MIPLRQVELNDINDNLEGHNDQLKQEVIHEIGHLDAIVLGDH